MTITTAQIRGARGLLDWSQAELSRRTGISTTSIGNIESGNTQPRESTLSVIRKAFEDGGIEFVSNNGVQVKNTDMKIYRGKDEFWDFYEDVYKTLLETPGEVLVSNVDERKFEQWMSQEQIDMHIERMKTLEGINYKVLLRSGDGYTPVQEEYCEYRWMPESLFTFAPFYLYGNCLAIMVFQDIPTVFVLKHKTIADAYRGQFTPVWEAAEKQPVTEEKIKGVV